MGNTKELAENQESNNSVLREAVGQLRIWGLKQIPEFGRQQLNCKEDTPSLKIDYHNSSENKRIK